MHSASYNENNICWNTEENILHLLADIFPYFAKEYNNLDSNLLKVGQKLLIPIGEV